MFDIPCVSAVTVYSETLPVLISSFGVTVDLVKGS